ncbi:unnamed protein product [Arctia plantaginis]|uniref:Gustatory receptor n=1 Tax=Arctia plantaginis TaxID=874455 RepID=A0A8S0ZC49_ARCPL|nr:unnamed protein product [Arctia plantaginis]
MLYRYSDLETPLQLECTVSGALSFVLHMSRIAAIAPIKFEKVRGGWRISLSRFYYAYTILFVILSHIITGFNTFDRREELVDGYESSSNKQSMPVLIAVLYTMGIVVGIPIAVTGDKRLRYMINCLFYVEQLNKKLDHLNAKSSSYTETKTWFKVFFLFMHGYVGSFLDYGIYLYDVIAANSNASVPIIESSSSTNENKNKEIRINIRNAISYNFSKVFSPSAIRGSRTNLNLLRKLINIYCTLCHMIKLLNEGNGVALIMMLLYSTSYMVTGPYFVVTVMYRTKSELPVFKIVSIVGWCILCFSMLLTVTEPCHQTHLQV